MSVRAGFRSEVLLNGDGETIAEALRRYLDGLDGQLREPYALAVATAYFDVGGFTQLREQLARAGRVRLLVGAEPQEPERRRRLRDGETPQAAARRAREEALASHFAGSSRRVTRSASRIEADRATRALVEWLRSGRVEVRRLRDHFLHAKAILVETGPRRGRRGQRQPHRRGPRAQPRARARPVPAVRRRAGRGLVRALVGRGRAVRPRGAVRAALPPARRPTTSSCACSGSCTATSFGAEAEPRARGRSASPASRSTACCARPASSTSETACSIADEVGLGKTFIAGELIRRAYFENRQRVLVVAPAALRDGPWRKFLARFDMRVETRSYDELVADSRINPKAEPGSDDARLGHPRVRARRRRRGAQRAQPRHAARGGASPPARRRTPPKKLVLLTATPVNNSLWDLLRASLLLRQGRRGLPAARGSRPCGRTSTRRSGATRATSRPTTSSTSSTRSPCGEPGRSYARWYADDRVELARRDRGAGRVPDPTASGSTTTSRARCPASSSASRRRSRSTTRSTRSPAS
ncbi:MAG: hypothetical protein KatS3mg012_2249 [Gaiellaceae bacterium]|nr:MAG: hypothetical protein KatS3mg012_2249 [Gaiellaceae bacterium]